MTFMEKREYMVKKWTYTQRCDNVFIIMRRELKIRVAFEPARMGVEHLHEAYELIVPVHQRCLNTKGQLKEAAEATTETIGRCGEEGSIS
jgi:hypothetical protein